MYSVLVVVSFAVAVAVFLGERAVFYAACCLYDFCFPLFSFFERVSKVGQVLVDTGITLGITFQCCDSNMLCVWCIFSLCCRVKILAYF